MGLRIIGTSLAVSLAMTIVGVGVWYLSVPLAAFIGNPHSEEAIGCVRFAFLGIFTASYILTFCYQVYQALKATDME